jgi:hypothetical protein
MDVRSVLLLAIAFWGTGSLVCLGLSFKNLLLTADQPRFASLNEEHPWARWASFAGGLSLGLLQSACCFIPLARREAVRIVSLDKPRWFHFFPPRQLCLVMATSMTCAASLRFANSRRASAACVLATQGDHETPRAQGRTFGP